MRWNLRKTRKSQRATCRQHYLRTGLAPEELERRWLLSVNVLTFHDNIASTGLNASETQLSPANVKVGTFSKLFAANVDGQIYAEPLVDTGVTIANGPNTVAGEAGVHDVLFVATEHDSLYAIDASPTGNGAILWQRTFTDLSAGAGPGTNINNPFGATAITSVPNQPDTSSTDIYPEIGITGTPVIDPAGNTLYVVAFTKEIVAGTARYVQRLHAINIADGTDRTTPYMIGYTVTNSTYTGDVNTTPIFVYGTGDGSTSDTYYNTSNTVVPYDALRENQRSALSLVNNTVYVDWASHGDNGPYHGWVVAWDVSNLATSGLVLKGVLNDSPNDGDAGIWEAGGGLVFESDGSAFYFEAGNGLANHGAPVLNSAGFPANGGYPDAIVKVVADPTTNAQNQNVNGWGLKVADFFIPYNEPALDKVDQDVGSGGPLLLPDSAGIPGHPHLLLAAGKQGVVYLIDRDNMGKYDPNNDHVLNSVPNGNGNNTPPVLMTGVLSTPAYFNGTIYYISGYSGVAKALSITPTSTGANLTVTSQTTLTFGYEPGSPVVSANGTIGGIVWLMDRTANQIHAYDATTLATELWNSGQQVGGVANVGAPSKFGTPTVANGEVFVGTLDGVVGYGLQPPVNAAPLAPSLSATALSGSSINLTWSDPTQSPNTPISYSIEQSSDGTTFASAATAPAGATSIAIGGLSPQTKHYFRIRGLNGDGYSPYSNIANAITTNQVAAIDFGAGFAGSATGGKLSYNGVAAVNVSSAQLTDADSQSGSVFATSPVDITKFTTQFTFQLLPAALDTADGFTFTIQGKGATALGSGGSGLGYAGISPSLAIKFDLFNNAGEGSDSTGMFLNGDTPTVPVSGDNAADISIDLSSTPINLHSGDVFQVNMSYDGATLTVVVLDATINGSATQNYTVNIPGVIGGNTAYVGFTGSTGGNSAIQDILTWTFAPNASQAPSAPTGLGATPASATSVNLTWTNTATNQTGFYLDRAIDPNFTESLITEGPLAAALSSYSDTYSGLAPSSTFYYRIRAFNLAGPSANSNTAQVTIPLAPAKPTNAQVTKVSATELDLSWTDNAGQTADGYHVQRAVDHGTFVLVATLPAVNGSDPLGTTYTWNDSSVLPGNFYEYHIQAFNVSGYNDFSGTNATTLTLPPSGLTATLAGSVVNLSWIAPSADPSVSLAYNIYRSTTSGGETGTVPIATGLTSTSFSDNTVLAGTTYYYEVTAVDAGGESGPSNEANSSHPNMLLDFSHGFAGSASTLAYNGPAAVNGAKAELTNGGLNQDSSVFSRTPVDITKFTTQFTFQIAAGTNTADGFTFAIQNKGITAVGASGGGLGYSGIGPGIGVKFGLFSSTSTPTAVSTTGLYLNGASPTGAANTIDMSTAGINLHSGDVFQANLTYDGATLTEVILDTATSASATETYSVNIPGALGGNDAYVGFTGATGALTATQDILTWLYTPTAVTAPSVPIGLTATPSIIGGAPQIALAWTASIGATSYNVYRGPTSGGEGTTPLVTGLTAPSFTDTGTTLGTTYYYTVAAVDADVLSAQSAEVPATVLASPAAPTGLTAVASAPGGTPQVTLTWTASANAVSYTVYRGTTPGGEAATPLATNVILTSYNDTGVTFGSNYYYEVTAVDAGGASLPSNEAAALTIPAAPSGLTATASNVGGTPQVTLNWTASTGAAGYNVYRGTTPGGESATPITSGVPGNTYADTNVVPGLTYYYKVAAVNAGGASPQSGEASAIVNNQLVLLNFGAGFAGSTSKLTFNGTATLPSGSNPVAAVLTNGGLNQAASLFSTTLLDVTRFTTQFTFQIAPGVSTADGFTFTIQDKGPTALGPVGGGLGYSGISPSVAVKFDLYNKGQKGSATGLCINGASPTTITSIPLTTIDLHSGHVFRATLTSDGTTLTVVLLDTTTNVSATQTYAVNIPATLKHTTAYVGFTAATGALTATQDILTWTYAVVPPAAPTNLAATVTTPATKAQVALSWTAAGAASYSIYRGTTPGGEGATAIKTGVTTTSYTDSSSALQFGTTDDYKVVAVNAAGASAASNEAQATPLAAAPTRTTPVSTVRSAATLAAAPRPATTRRQAAADLAITALSTQTLHPVAAQASGSLAVGDIAGANLIGGSVARKLGVRVARVARKIK
ncbi:MAG: fibronectin type III domain-containing protein [Thermoguttaceae bacterium]